MTEPRNLVRALSRVCAVAMATAIVVFGIYGTLYPFGWLQSRGLLLITTVFGSGWFWWYALTGRVRMPLLGRDWYFAVMGVALLGFGVLGLLSDIADRDDRVILWLCIAWGVAILAAVFLARLVRPHNSALQRTVDT
jgi:hypothetical protein